MLHICSLSEGSLKNKAGYSAPVFLGIDFNLEPSVCRFCRRKLSKAWSAQLNSFLSPMDLNLSFPEGPIVI